MTMEICALSYAIRDQDSENDAKTTIAPQIRRKMATKLSVRSCKPRRQNHSATKFEFWTISHNLTILPSTTIHSIFSGCTEYVSIPELNQFGAPNVHHCRMKTHH